MHLETSVIDEGSGPPDTRPYDRVPSVHVTNGGFNPFLNGHACSLKSVDIFN